MKNRIQLTLGLMFCMAGILCGMPVALAAEASATAPQLRVAPLATPSGPRTFMVFFDYDSVAISRPARDLLASISSLVKEGGVTALTLTGHTDTAGSRLYNLRLSQSRALAVSAILRQAGVPESVMQVYWRGEFEPLIPTQDDVDEFRNRRVEIVVQ